MIWVTNLSQDCVPDVLPPGVAVIPAKATEFYTSQELHKMGMVGIGFEENLDIEIKDTFWQSVKQNHSLWM